MNSRIKTLLKNKSIIDYLADRGILPEKTIGDKALFKCPLHEGDNDPSFTVYLNQEYQTYYCFGCKSGVTIINLMKALDKINTKEALIKLNDGVDITSLDFLRDAEEELEKLVEGKEENYDSDVASLALKINSACYQHLKRLNFDKDEIDFFEKVYEKISYAINTYDCKSLNGIYDFLVDFGFVYRTQLYLEKKERELLKIGQNN